ncbi:hypothetical protein [Pedobacter sp. JCM 36344]|uniref:hypothetical protein n=1 Tax=Pedobacter sp. JCM 36344 TaxID=3374280 RepID=UPI003978C54D
MKLNHLFTGMLVVTALVVTSCSTPRVAQQGAVTDDVYNSNAQAKVYVPAPVRTVQPATQEYQEDDYYGTSDPYYDMDYSSRINRFSYGSAWRSYYDPYFYGYNDFYGGFGGGFGWGSLYSPFYGYNNWGFNNWGYGSYFGGGLGGYYGGGFLGGGYYGGGYYTGRTTNVPDYKARPYVGRENGVGTNRGMAKSTTRRSDVNGNPTLERSRSERYNPNDRAATVPSRSDRSNAPAQRPTRTESAPARPAPTYSPPTRSESSRGSGSSSSGSSSGSSGGGARPTRAGRG